jgi:acyl carrier protein
VSESVDATPERAALEERVVAIVVSIVGARPLAADATWRSLGMDSLDLLTLVTSIEDEFALRIPDPVAMRLQTMADVLALVSAR